MKIKTSEIVINTNKRTREEAPRPRRLRLVEELTVRVTQRVGPHIREPNRPFTARVREQVTRPGVELRGGDHLREVLHVPRLDVHDVEARVVAVQVPQVDAQVIRAAIGGRRGGE